MKALEVAGGDLEPVVTQLSQPQQERDALRAELAAAETLHEIKTDRTAVEAEVLEAPPRFEPDGKTYRFSGPVATGKLIAGGVLPRKGMSPTGIERMMHGPLKLAA